MYICSEKGMKLITATASKPESLGLEVGQFWSFEGIHLKLLNKNVTDKMLFLLEEKIYLFSIRTFCVKVLVDAGNVSEWPVGVKIIMINYRVTLTPVLDKSCWHPSVSKDNGDMRHGVICGRVTAPTVFVESDFGMAGSVTIPADKVRAWRSMWGLKLPYTVCVLPSSFPPRCLFQQQASRCCAS